MARPRKNDPVADGDVSTVAPSAGRLHTASYTRIKDQHFKWFIRVVGPSAEKFSGRDIPVSTKKGEEHPETLAKMIWNGEDKITKANVAIYEFVAKPRVEDEDLSDEIPF